MKFWLQWGHVCLGFSSVMGANPVSGCSSDVYDLESKVFDFTLNLRFFFVFINRACGFSLRYSEIAYPSRLSISFLLHISSLFYSTLNMDLNVSDVMSCFEMPFNAQYYATFPAMNRCM